MIDRRSIERSLNTHMIWKIRFEFAIGRSFDIEIPSSTLSAHNLCPFGKWLHAQAPSANAANAANAADEAAGDDFAIVSRLHTEFHKIAGKIKECIETGEASKARDLLLTEFEETSSVLVSALRVWADKLPAEESGPFSLDFTQACIPAHEMHRHRFQAFIHLV